MRRPSPLVLALIGAGLALPAAAAPALQDGAPRTLSWQGRPALAMDAAHSDAPLAARRANRPIPHGGHATPESPTRGLTPAPGPRAVGLTPANAWLRNRAPAAPHAEVVAEDIAPAAEIAPPPAPPPPAPMTRPAPLAPPVVRAAPPPAPAPAPAPVDYLPEQGGEGQPTPASLAYPPPPPVEASPAPAADPYAPRRDAPIFRLQRPGPAPQPQAAPAPTAGQPAAEAGDAPRPRRVATVTPNTADRPPSQGARYYSLHRQSGRTPDAVALPAPTYIDALAVNLAETPASQDLAEPAPAPTLIRDASGRMRVAPAASDGDHQ